MNAAADLVSNLESIRIATVWAYFAVLSAPLWWPGCIVLFRRRHLPRRLMFVGVVAALSYGVLFLFVFLLAIPAQFHALFIAPVLQQQGRPYGSAIVSAARYFEQYGWLVLPPALLALTVGLTHSLARRWTRICEAIKG